MLKESKTVWLSFLRRNEKEAIGYLNSRIKSPIDTGGYYPVEPIKIPIGVFKCKEIKAQKQLPSMPDIVKVKAPELPLGVLLNEIIILSENEGWTTIPNSIRLSKKTSASTFLFVSFERQMKPALLFVGQ